MRRALDSTKRKTALDRESGAVENSVWTMMMRLFLYRSVSRFSMRKSPSTTLEMAMAAFNSTHTESEALDGSAAPVARQPWHRPQIAELPPDEAAEARRRIDNLGAARAAVAAQADSG
jgi:hypothetical protein